MLLPDADYVGISRKISDKEERERLNMVCGETSGGMGIVVRTAACGVTEELLRKDITELVASWKVLSARERVAKSPCMLRRSLICR